jgi:hypothetical protein
MIIHEFTQPIPVHTELGDAYALLIKSNGMWENDEVLCVMKADGQWRHFNSGQIKSHHNGSYNIAMYLARKNIEKNEPK